MARMSTPYGAEPALRIRPEEWEGIAVRAQAEVAQAQIAAGEEALIATARLKVRKAAPYIDEETVNRRALAIVTAAKNNVEQQGAHRAFRDGAVHECGNCRFKSGYGSWCAHPLAIIGRTRSDGKVTFDTSETAKLRSPSGACGPEAILWVRRRPLQLVRYANRGEEWAFALVGTLISCMVGVLVLAIISSIWKAIL